MRVAHPGEQLALNSRHAVPCNDSAFHPSPFGVTTKAKSVVARSSSRLVCTPRLETITSQSPVHEIVAREKAQPEAQLTRHSKPSRSRRRSKFASGADDGDGNMRLTRRANNVIGNSR